MAIGLAELTGLVDDARSIRPLTVAQGGVGVGVGAIAREKFSAACGESDDRTIERWLCGETVPGPWQVANLCELFGAVFKNEIEALGSFVAAHRQDAAFIVGANACGDIGKKTSEIRRALDTIDEHAGKLSRKDAA